MLLIPSHTDTTVAFAEFLAVLINQQTQMTELWGSPAKSIVELDVFGCRNEPFLVACVSPVDPKGVCLFTYSAPDHMRDLHVFIVHHIGEVISRKSISLDDDVVIFKLLFPEVVVDDVSHSRRGLCASESDGKLLAFVCPLL